jgi:acetyl-CoA carboxylase/biotin carboxylase 1
MVGKRSLVAALVLVLGLTAHAFFGPAGSAKTLMRTHQAVARGGKRALFLPASSAVVRGSISSSSTQRHAVEIEDEVDVKLDLKKRATVDTFVQKMGGKRSLQRILIANNGMAATKAILSMRQWAYMTLGDERAIEFVAMATRDDLNANAEFIRLADSFVEVRS